MNTRYAMIKLVILFSFTICALYAGSSTHTYHYYCFGYGDGEGNYNDGIIYNSGIKANKTDCGNGCYVNCVYKSDYAKVIDTSTWTFNSNAASSGVTFYRCATGYCKSSGYDAFMACRTNYCAQDTFSTRPTDDSSGTGDPDDDTTGDDDEEISEIVIEENSVLGTNPQNIVYTKTSGSSLDVRLYHLDKTGSIGSGLESASCIVTLGSKTIASGSASYSLLSGGGAFVWSTSYATPSTGTYRLKCTGVASSTGATVASSTLTYNVVPASYSMGATITSSTSTTTSSKGFDIDSQTLPSDGSTKEISLSSFTSSFPIAKVGDNIAITISGSANTQGNAVDSGVNTMISASSFDNSVIGYNSTTSGTSVCPTAPSTPTSNDIDIYSGNFSGAAGALAFSEAFRGTITISYTDLDIKSIVDSDKAAGKCSGSGASNGSCPYPPTFTYVFDYYFVPYNFSVKMLGADNDDIKVLYFGQGSSPLNETANVVQVTALGTDQNALTNYISGCAALDVDLELTGNNMYIGLIDPATGAESNTIAATSFTSGSVANEEKVLLIRESEDTVFDPSSVIEPVFFNQDIEPLMYFTGKKDDSNYPQYTPYLSGYDTVVLRGRINMIDADNAENYNTMPTTKVYYEFYCRTCDLCQVGKITGVDSDSCTTSDYQRSPTQQGWFIDETFQDYNATSISADNITTDTISVSKVGSVDDGVQEINYSSTSDAGKYQVKVNQGTSSSDFPLFLLYNVYYNSNITNWGTSAFVTIHKESSSTNSLDFGLDAGDAKNTRSDGRIGGY